MICVLTAEEEFLECSDVGYQALFSLLPEENHDKLCLDFGCGDGEITKYLKFKEVAGLDLFRDTLLEAHKLGYQVVLGDMHHLPFRECCFDYLVARHVLEHSIALVKVIWELHVILKNDGFLCCEVPETNDGLENGSNREHHYYLMPSQWRRYLENNGFEVVEEKVNVHGGVCFLAVKSKKFKLVKKGKVTLVEREVTH